MHFSHSLYYLLTLLMISSRQFFKMLWAQFLFLFIACIIGVKSRKYFNLMPYVFFIFSSKIFQGFHALISRSIVYFELLFGFARLRIFVYGSFLIHMSVQLCLHYSLKDHSLTIELSKSIDCSKVLFHKHSVLLYWFLW